jgi:transposase InsO family protein
MILRLGQDQLKLVRRDAQARAQMVQVLLDQVGRRHHAAHLTLGRSQDRRRSVRVICTLLMRTTPA